MTLSRPFPNAVLFGKPIPRQQGFSLLEAIVALVLIASTGMTLFSWINSNLISLGRVQQITQQQQAMHNALAFMETVNPMERPSGEIDLGTYAIRWQAQAVEPEKDGVGYPAGISLYQVGLYDSQVWITDEDREIARFVLRQVGYRQVREVDLDF